ncbi:MAG: flavodoxin domain-containing protein [Ignavibacteriae bacterium]|nr:flavodoxin domain-containing protein [Ignavibacteriota bacterium]
MKKALIIYNSKKGTTKKFGEEIGYYLNSKKINSKIIPIYDFNENEINEYNYIFLGCWTSGLFICMQHPQQDWIEFSKKLPNLKNKKVGLFTTYKFATGSMFSKMKVHLKSKIDNISLELKSRSGVLSESNITELLKFAD